MGHRWLTMLLVAFLIMIVSELHAQGQGGYWKQVKVEELPLYKSQIPSRYVGRESIDALTRNGYMEGKYSMYDFGGKTSDDLERVSEGFVSWAPPPLQAKPGDVWQGGYQAKITKIYDRNLTTAGQQYNHLTLEVNTSAATTNMAGYTLGSSVNSPVGIYTSTDKRVNVPKKPEFVFPDKNQDPYKNQKFMVIQLTADFATGAQAKAYFNYYYEWVPAGPREVSGNFRMILKNNHGGFVRNLTVKITNLEDKTTGEYQTDKNGEVKQQFRAVTSNDDLGIRVDSVLFTPATVYTIALEKPAPAFVYRGKKIEVKVNREFKLNQQREAIVTYNVTIPLARVLLSPLKWSEQQQKWVSCQAAVQGRGVGGDFLFLLTPPDFEEKNGAYSRVVYFPTASVLKHDKVELLAADLVDKLKDFKVLPLSSKAKIPPMITFLLCDNAMTVARVRGMIKQYFLPLLGENLAQQLANLKIQLDPTRQVPAYLNGVMFLPAEMDLTKDETCDTLMHEWTHYIMDVVAQDPDIESRVGGAHDVWTRAATNELAWDEARAHFSSALLTRGNELPNSSRGFSMQTSQRAIQSIPQAGDCVEGVIASSLLDYYTKAGYTKSRDVYRDFLDVQEQAKKTLGHPPRTSQEFFEVKKRQLENLLKSGNMDAATAKKQADAVDATVSAYQVSKP